MAYTDRNRRNRKPPIKDGFDNILENNGFYRKQVARDNNTLFRAIADGLFQTQYYRFIVAKRAELIMNRDKTLLHDENNNETDGHLQLLRHLGQSLKFRYEFVNAMDEEVSIEEFDPIPTEGENSQSYPCIQLCNSPWNKYDPIYSVKKVEKMAMCQSILYEVLYVDIFKMSDAMEAAATMLCGPIDPVKGKPEELDPDFDGTAMEALENFLIPFPYKVAKCFDPYTYRNIEFDAWTQEMKENSPIRSRNASISSRCNTTPQRNERKTIGNLPSNTPCMLNYPDYGRQYGYVLGPTLDRRKMEVYIPLHDQCVFVDRSLILPINQLPKNYLDLPRRPDDVPRFFENYNRNYSLNYDAAVEEARNLNKNGLNYSDTTSEDTGDDPRRQRASRFNFNVPPPTLPLSPNGQPFFQQPQQSIARSLIPPPLNLNRIEQAYMPSLCSPAICEERSCPGFGGPLTPCCCDDCLALQQNMVNLQTSGFLPIVRTPEVATPVMINTPVPNFIMSPLMGPTTQSALPAAMTPTVFIPTTSSAAVTPGLRRVFQFPSPVVTPLTTSINPEGNVFVFPTFPTENPRNMMPMPHPRQGP